MAENPVSKKLKEEAKKRAKDIVKGAVMHVLPYLLIALIVIIILAWIFEALDYFRFENMFGWLKATDSGYIVDNQGIYHIEGFLDDYEYKLINTVNDNYDEDLFYEELENAHFDKDLFTSDSEENKILYQLIINGLDISEYDTEEELKCLPLFIKASVSNSSPHLGLTSGEFKGKIEIYRQEEGETSFKQLKFIKKDKLKEKIDEDKKNSRKYFSLTDDGKIMVGVNNATEEKWQFPGVNSKEAKRHPDYGKDDVKTSEYKELLLEYQNVIGSHIISFEFLHSMLLKTKNPDFCKELANNIKYDGLNPIQLYIYDNTLVEETVVNTLYRGDLQLKYLYNCNITYTDVDGNVYPEHNNWDFYLKTPGKDYFKTEPYEYEHKYTKIKTYSNPIIILQKANSIFYNYERPICTITESTSIPTVVINPFEGAQYKEPGSPELEISPILLPYTVIEEATNEYQIQNPLRIVNNIWCGWIGSTGTSKGNIYKYFLTEEKEETITYTQTKAEYTESPANVEFNENNKSFYQTFIDEEHKEARAEIYINDISLFEMLALSPKTSYFIDLLKYTMWRESGQNYGVTNLELLNLLEQVEANSMYQSAANQVLQFDIEDSTYFITDSTKLFAALSGYSELQAQVALLIQQQTQYGINAITVVSAAIMQTEGGNNTSIISGTNNLFGILNPDGSIKVYSSKEESIKDFYQKLKNQINTNNTTSTNAITAAVFEHSSEDQIEWKKNYDATILETYKKQTEVEIPSTLGWGTPTINPNHTQDGYMFTYPSKSGRIYTEWAQNMGPWRSKKSGGNGQGSDWCAKTAVCTISSGYGSTASPAYFGSEYPSVINGLKKLTNDAVSVTIAGTAKVKLPAQEKERLINHLKTGDPVILRQDKDIGGQGWTSSQHYLSVLDINDNNEVYLSNPYYSAGQRGWMSLDFLLTKGISQVWYIKTK